MTRRVWRVLFSAAVLSMFASGALAEEVEFASKKDEIIKALEGKDGTKTIDGVTYELKKGKVYKILPNGMKVKMRGLGGVVQTRISPKVALPIQFKHNSDEPTEQGQKILGELGQALVSKTLRGSSFLICGHTDSDGLEKYNLELSRKRAERVKKYLSRKHKIPGKNLKVEGIGEAQPVASNETAEGKAKNRRVEITRLIKQ
jgi:outer membrane protein OmpA-like peptidoglycan-associated protein